MKARQQRKAKAVKAALKSATPEAMDEAQRVAIVGGKRPKSQAQAVAAAWRWAAWVKRNPHVRPSQRLTEFQAALANVTTAFIFRAMGEWKPDMLRELAREMKRGGPPEKWEPNRANWFLTDAAREGELNLSLLQREAQSRKVLTQSLRTWRRQAHKLGWPIRGAGQPKK